MGPTARPVALEPPVVAIGPTTNQTTPTEPKATPVALEPQVLTIGPANNKTTQPKPHVLLIEDVHEAAGVLADAGHTVTRITYTELMTLGGDAILRRLLDGEFYMLWCQTPTLVCKATAQACNPVI